MSLPPSEPSSLAFIGGTGPEGRGLAIRFAQSGHAVTIGSRSVERAEETAAHIASVVSDSVIRGATNEVAARAAEIVVLTIPYGALSSTLPPLAGATAGKIVVSTIAPIDFLEGRPVARHVDAGSAAQEVQNLLPEARVVSAFQVVDAHLLHDLSVQLDTDVIVCSDDVDARRVVVSLAGRLPGVRALSGGRLAASRYVEECTALLITLNRIYKAHSGLRITGIQR